MYLLAHNTTTTSAQFRSKGLNTFCSGCFFDYCKCLGSMLSSPLNLVDLKFSMNSSCWSAYRQNSTSSSLSLLSSQFSLKSWNLSQPELALGTSLQNSSSLTFQMTLLRPVTSFLLSVLLSMSRQGEDQFSTTKLFLSVSAVLVARDIVTCCCGSWSMFSAGFVRIAGLTILVDWKTLLEYWLLLVALLGLTEVPLLSNMRCLRCTLLVSFGSGDILCCWLQLRLEQFSIWLERTEFVSDCSLRLATFSCVTSIIFFDFCSRSLSWFSRWCIHATYSFSFMLNSFILDMNRCSVSLSRAIILLSDSLYSLFTRSISFRQCSSTFLTALPQFSLIFPKPNSSYFFASFASSFFSKLSPSLSTTFLVSLTTSCIFFSMAKRRSLVWLLGSARLRDGRCDKWLSFLKRVRFSVCASSCLTFSVRYWISFSMMSYCCGLLGCCWPLGPSAALDSRCSLPGYSSSSKIITLSLPFSISSPQYFQIIQPQQPKTPPLPPKPQNAGLPLFSYLWWLREMGIIVDGVLWVYIMDNQQSFKLAVAAQHHIQSFNFISDCGLQKILNRFVPMELHEKDILPQLTTHKAPNLTFKSLKLTYSQLRIGKPYRYNDPSALTQQIFPQECRLAGKTYTAPLLAQISREIDGNLDTFSVNLGEVPIMVRSTNCHLDGLSEQQLIKLTEDPNEYGGYFIVNGNEKMIRMLILQKRNYPVAFLRPSYTNRGPGYTQFAVQMRCVRDDFYAKTFTLHYISDGNVYLRILYKKQEFLCPIIIILKAIGNFSDRQVYTRLMKGNYNDSDRSDKLEVLIKTGRSLGLYTQTQFLEYIGKNFRLLLGISNVYTDKQAGEIFLSENICVHLNTPKEKFHTLCLMIDKLYCLVNHQIMAENLDSLAVHQALLPGHLYLMILREKLEDNLSFLRSKILKDINNNKNNSANKVVELDYLKKNLQINMIGKALQYFLSTGNLKSRTGLDLMQDKGFCVIADKLNNMRFLSHFRSIHRGAYFAEMKTTTVRKLLPESWGFLCPVHTPDGGPCGLLNHITISCCPLTHEPYDSLKHENLNDLCVKHGMHSLESYNYVSDSDCYPIMINGSHAGYIQSKHSQSFLNTMKHLKVEGVAIPKETEIAFMKKGHFKNTVYPVIFITTAPARFLRPVRFNPLNKTEWVSPFQQISIDIDLPQSDYSEYSPTNFLSILPQHIPFLNYNQSPRNMYQCQMAKQTMGTSVLNWDYRFDNKLYRILHSQKPLVRTKFYEDLKFSDYNSGTNAVVAVLSYTGYDMEDAMIINKSSYEQGFGHGCVYKTVQYLLSKDQMKKPPKFKLFKDAPLQMQKLFQIPQYIESDGVIKVGAKLKKMSPMLILYEVAKKSFKTFYNKQSEPCSVQSVLVTGGDNKSAEKIFVKLRFDRRPVIGDKFSSRHGQKGVLSMLWPKIDMPFTESGMTPDVIINPNAFPSRMTIGMLIESMAAKSMALEGNSFKYEVFQPYENDNVADYFGTKLLSSGFNYYGNQTMYSGVYGTELKVDIYMGLVYYQRLRHMVHDKSQARSTGPVDILTQQPLKGRKKGGGIRMGEMERDALLAHGLSQTVNERLFRSSDRSDGFVCNKCGLMISCFKKMDKISGNSLQQVYDVKTICTNCNSNDCSLVAIPYVMKYLINELAAMNIRMRFKLKV